MKTLWERRIAHIDRRVGPLDWPDVRRQMLKADVRHHRGLPSRSVSSNVVDEMLAIKAAQFRGERLDGDRTARLQWMQLRDRLLERKRVRRAAVRRRTGFGVNGTKINLWRRRQQWLREAEAEAQSGRGV